MSASTTQTTAPPPGPPADPDQTPRLAAQHVTMRFGGIVALDDVSVAVPPGQIVGLVGPNGAGKSTLFGVLSGLLRPTSGTVHMDGEDVSHARPQIRARHGLARTFQHPELFSGLTVREHLVLAHRVKFASRRLWADALTGGGFRRPEQAETQRVDELLGALGLTAIADRSVVGLPLGMSRLVEVGRAMAVAPTVLLLDEPSSGLDAEETEHLATVLRRVVEVGGTSLLFVEHDVDLVLSLSSYVYVLDFGVLIAEGTPTQIRTDPAVRAAYLGEESDAHPAPEAAAATSGEQA
jgi:ABC-type branched-subunit amino acid transport system ATPase component